VNCAEKNLIKRAALKGTKAHMLTIVHISVKCAAKHTSVNTTYSNTHVHDADLPSVKITLSYLLHGAESFLRSWPEIPRIL
jgi:hypothetical protein